jgi:hypothetical protein
MLVDEVQGGQYRVQSQPEQKVAADEVTLLKILHRSHKPRLNRAWRFQIALKIASSHLQLHSTPWARKQWQSADVRFPQTSPDGSGVLLDRPFVSASFEATPASSRAPRLSDRSFGCLGIMLLELLFDTQIEEHGLWQQLGAHNTRVPMYRLIVARQWADDVEGDAGTEFLTAVDWCLNKSPTTLEGDQWRKDLACEVVLPLQHCCEWTKRKPAKVDYIAHS